MSVHLLIIDPQVDFCDPERGTLCVAGADADMERLAAFVGRHGDEIDAIHVTLDSHHFYDIAHPVFWQDGSGNHPDPFTTITAEDIAVGRWLPVDDALGDRALLYAQKLESGGRYALTVWPPHCLIGSPGHAVMPVLFNALKAWESSGRFINYVIKGLNPYTEHYSAIRAEVPDPLDPDTQTNVSLLDKLSTADEIVVAGEALSHCVANTVLDIVDTLGGASRIVLLTDAAHSVPGFEDLGNQFVVELKTRGMQTVTTLDRR